MKPKSQCGVGVLEHVFRGKEPYCHCGRSHRSVKDIPQDLDPDNDYPEPSFFGWWARGEDENGSFYWLGSDYSTEEVSWRCREDPDCAYQFPYKHTAEKAICDFLAKNPTPGCTWQAVEHKDDPAPRLNS